MSGAHRIADHRSFAIPIVDAHCRIVGWSAVSPNFEHERVENAEAEILVGDLMPAYVEIEDANLATRAGAPAGWAGPWRCLGICSKRIFNGHLYDDGPPTVRVRACAS
jgi:hypothetical protein